jgi:hypothetical protein
MHSAAKEAGHDGSHSRSLGVALIPSPAIAPAEARIPRTPLALPVAAPGALAVRAEEHGTAVAGGVHALANGALGARSWFVSVRGVALVAGRHCVEAWVPGGVWGSCRLGCG